MRCPNCGEYNEEGAIFCGECGMRLPKVAENKKEKERNETICIACGEPLEKDALFCGNCGARVADLENESDSDDGWDNAGIIRTILVRRSSGEKINIDKYPFVIGRNNTCDYTIMNNLAIGRQHVKIDCVNNNIVLTDLGSANHTFVEDSQINGSTVLHDGMKIRLADEAFDLIIYEV